ncbi:MAG: hypothetical protein M3346_04095 [Actinomycetota bacterium]|nr:hypothetical protein [Actinomycetota bacterium]
MPVNPRAILTVIGTAAMLKQRGDGAGGKSARRWERNPRIITASTAVLVAGGGLYYLWRNGQRRAQGVLDAGAQSAVGVESTVVVEETVVVVEEPGSGPAPEAMSGNGQEAVYGESPTEAGAPEPIANADSVEGSEHPGGHPGGVSDVIASPEAVVDPEATPDPIVSPEPALPQQTDDSDSDQGSGKASSPEDV